MLYTGQGRYGRKPLQVNTCGRGAISSGAISKVPKFDPLSVSGCFNCGNPNHMWKDCPNPLNVAIDVSSKLKYYAKKKGAMSTNVQLVLAEVCYQMDNSLQVNDTHQNDSPESYGSDGTIPEKDLFESVLEDVNVNFSRTTSTGQRAAKKVTWNPATEHLLYTKFNEFDEHNDTVIGMSDTEFSAVGEFLGECIDTGAQRSVIGKPQATAY